LNPWSRLVTRGTTAGESDLLLRSRQVKPGRQQLPGFGNRQRREDGSFPVLVTGKSGKMAASQFWRQVKAGRSQLPGDADGQAGGSSISRKTLMPIKENLDPTETQQAG
jgi:hypothetical protein